MKKKLLFILLFIPFFSWSQDGKQPIIDMHLHDYTEQTYFTAPGFDGIVSPPSLSEYRKQVDSMLKKYNVVKAVVSTIGGDNRIDSNNVLIPGYYTNKPPTDTLAFKRLIETGKLKVFGEIGAIYGGYTLSDPGFEPYLDICERYDIPVAVHTGGGPPDITYRGNPNFRIKLGDPFTIEDVLAKHPKLRIYIMHAGEVFYENAAKFFNLDKNGN